MAKRSTGKVTAAKRKARREGWAQWITSEADERAVLAGYRFDVARAEHVQQWGLKYLRHCEGDWYGKPFELMDWQRERLFYPLFGWCHDSEEWGRTVRRFRRCYVQVPKKMGKSPTGAYVGLYMLAGDGEKGAKVYSASTDKNQASIVHNHACAMAEASPALMKRLKINRTTRTISYAAVNSSYAVLSACPRRNEGWNAHCVVADELHKWYGRELWDALKWAFASRAEPLLFVITTAGDDTTSVCYEQYEYAKAVADGRLVDHAYLPVIFEAEPEDDPHAEETWAKANPSLGQTVKLSDFKSDYQEASQSTGLFEAWKQLRLNVWRSSVQPWLDVNKWDAGPAKRRRKAAAIDCYQDYTEADLAGRPCWGGLDLSLTTDLTALCLVFPDEDTEDLERATFHTLDFFWLPEATAEEERKKVTWSKWAEAGYVTLTRGSETDFDAVREAVVELAEQFHLMCLLFDPMYAAYLTQRLELEHGIPRASFGQTIMNFAEPSAMLERLISKRKIYHNGNQVTRWCVGNVAVKTDSNQNMRPVKPRKGDVRRIDGVVAKLMALGGAMKREGEEPPADYYEDHDVEFL